MWGEFRRARASEFSIWIFFEKSSNFIQKRPLWTGTGDEQRGIHPCLLAGRPTASIACLRKFFEPMNKYFSFNSLAQAGLIILTLSGFLLTSLKLPQYGLIVGLFSQVFWLYSSYKAWKEANQVGIFVTTIFITLILIFGVINYWLLS